MNEQTFHQFHDLDTGLDFQRITSGFHGAFATGVASQQGTLTLSDNWFRPPVGDLLMLQLLRPVLPNLPYLFSTFHFKYPLVLSRFCFEKATDFVGNRIMNVRVSCFLDPKDTYKVLHGYVRMYFCIIIAEYHYFY